jgi:hypothetical protein
MGTTCSHKPANVKATDFLIDNHLTWDSHDKETGDKHTVLATALVGMREFYAAVEHVKADGTREVWAAVLKVSWYPKDHYNCCVKAMSEFEGPYCHNCPEKILKLLTPTDSEYANTWREKCWANVNRKKVVKKVGDVVRLYDHDYKLVEDLGRKGFRAYHVDSGNQYRLKLNQVKEATLVTEEPHEATA